MFVLKSPLFSILLLTLLGCASSVEDEYLDNPAVPGSAYVTEAFTFYVEPPLHPEWKPVKFYFKDCEENGLGNHISRTSYSCSYP